MQYYQNWKILVFKKKQKISLPTSPIVYPHGICVHTSAGLFLIRDNKRYRFPTQRIFESWAFPFVVRTTEAAVQKYPIIAKLGFRDSSLIYNISDGKMYLISNNKRRHITSPEALDRLGLKREDFVVVSQFEVNLQEEGESIS